MGIATQSSQQSGIAVYLEPSYNFKDYKTGLRIETASVYMKYIGSTVLTADRYLSRKYDFRPFVGGGIGSYSVDETAGCGGGLLTGSTGRSTNPLGGMLRTGFETSHLRLSFEYNMVANTYVHDYDDAGKLLGTTIYKNAYFGLNLGLCIGGGKKKIKPGQRE